MNCSNVQPLSAAISQIITDNIDGVIATPTVGGGIKNVKDINSGVVKMGISMGTTVWDGLQGNPPFEEKTTNVRAICQLYFPPIQFVVKADSNINSFYDLKDKNLGVSPKGWTLEQFNRKILGLYDLDYDLIKASGGQINYAGYQDMAILMKDRHLDLATFFQPYPASTIMNIVTSFPIRLLSLDEEKADEFLEKYPGSFKTEIPAGIYKGQEDPAITIGTSHLLIVDKRLSNELVYEITKAIFNNLESFKKVHPVLNEFDINRAVKNMPIPFHEGAEKYYKERGVL
ncbi:hypothetical protein ES708_19523 [subsurface metagenome]